MMGRMKRKGPTIKRGLEAAAFVAVLALGWRIPWLSYCLAINVAVGLAGAFLHGGRHGCGTFCPRGAFYSFLPDTGRKIPRKLLAGKTSLFVMPLLLAALWAAFRPETARDWGVVLYAMIAVTTAAGLAGWLLANRHFWCAVCPMGKLYKAIRPGKTALAVDGTCVGCGLCAKACPFGFDPPKESVGGLFRNADCMHCGRCVARCPKGALSWRGNSAGEAPTKT